MVFNFYFEGKLCENVFIFFPENASMGITEQCGRGKVAVQVKNETQNAINNS